MENQAPIVMGSIFPPEIRTVAVVAPSGPPDPQALAAGIALLERSGLRVLAGPELRERGCAAYLAHDREVRLAALNRAIRDPEVDLILCARGGFGAVHLLPGIDWATLRERHLPLMGYSDITALHAGLIAERAGVPVAGPMVCRMSESLPTGFTLASLRTAFAGKPGERLAEVTPGGTYQAIRGLPFAANLTVLASLCGTPFQPDLAGRILILEDIGEPLYKVDRMLTQLALAGLFRGIAALCFGSFTGTEDGEGLRRLEEEMARTLDVPFFRDFPFGHTFPIVTVHGGRFLVIEDGTVRLG